MAEIVALPQERLITGEELYSMPGVGPCEFIDGRIVPRTPTGDEHGGIEINFGAALKTFVSTRRLGRARGGEVGIFSRRNPDRVRAADVLFISSERYRQRKITEGYLDVAPELVYAYRSLTDVREFKEGDNLIGDDVLPGFEVPAASLFEA